RTLHTEVRIGAWFFPDGRRALVLAGPARNRTRASILDIERGGVTAVSPEANWRSALVAPDGNSIACTDDSGAAWRYPLDAGEPSRIPGVEASDILVQWSADGKFLYGFKDYQVPLKVFRLEIATGRKEVWKEIRPDDPAGVVDIWLEMTRDAEAYAYNFRRVLSDLFLVDGLK